MEIRNVDSAKVFVRQLHALIKVMEIVDKRGLELKMTGWIWTASERNGPGLDCGTVACICGWAVLTDQVFKSPYFPRAAKIARELTNIHATEPDRRYLTMVDAAHAIAGDLDDASCDAFGVRLSLSIYPMNPETRYEAAEYAFPSESKRRKLNFLTQDDVTPTEAIEYMALLAAKIEESLK